MSVDLNDTVLYQTNVMPWAYSEENMRSILRMDYITILHADDKFYTEARMKDVRDAGLRLWMNALGNYYKMSAANTGSS